MHNPKQKLAEIVLGPVEWLSETEGYCACPGQDRHTGKAGARDCKLYLDKVPTLACFHGSCQAEVEQTNRTLRLTLLEEESTVPGKRKRLTKEEKERMAETKRRESLRRRAASSKQQILEKHRWTYAEILGASPVKLPEDAAEHWRLLLEKFHAGDVVWVGDTYDSGKPENVKNFRPVEQWLAEGQAPAQFVCPVAFKAGSYSRSNENVVARRFLVVESDELNKDEVGAVFRWLKEKVGLKLVAIVDTAGKSLHAWFEYPEEATVAELKLVLPELGCDPKLFTASQPVRLPGAMREGKRQRLVYLAGKEVRS